MTPTPLLAEVSEVRTRIGQKIEALLGDALKSGLPALLARLDQEILSGVEVVATASDI